MAAAPPSVVLPINPPGRSAPWQAVPLDRTAIAWPTAARVQHPCRTPHTRAESTRVECRGFEAHELNVGWSDAHHVHMNVHNLPEAKETN
jgi:hypothetical protein